MIELKNNPAGNFFLLAGPCVIEGEEMAISRRNYKYLMYLKALIARPTVHAWIHLWE